MPHRRRILVVEDNPTSGPLIVRELTHEFGSHGYLVSLETTLAGGLESARENNPCCVVLDAGLPDAEGSEFSVIDRIPEFGTRVVIYTGSGDASLFNAVRPHGASIVEKGFGSVPFLIAAIWNEINFEDGDRDSGVAQQTAQRRVTQDGLAAIQESTLVSIGLGRVFAIVGMLIVGTVSITAIVLNKVAGVDSNVTSIRTDLAAYTIASTKRQDGFEVALKEQTAATQARILEWSKWRWNVSRDIRQLGQSTNTPVTTNPE